MCIYVNICKQASYIFFLLKMKEKKKGKNGMKIENFLYTIPY